MIWISMWISRGTVWNRLPYSWKRNPCPAFKKSNYPEQIAGTIIVSIRSDFPEKHCNISFWFKSRAKGYLPLRWIKTVIFNRWNVPASIPGNIFAGNNSALNGKSNPEEPKNKSRIHNEWTKTPNIRFIYIAVQKYLQVLAFFATQLCALRLFFHRNGLKIFRIT